MLFARAHRLRIDEAVIAACQSALQAMNSDPEEFGDALYHGRDPQGVVHHAVRGPLLFRFVVYKQQKVVFLWLILAMSSSALDRPD
jgi:hypothetical protein